MIYFAPITDYVKKSTFRINMFFAVQPDDFAQWATSYDKIIAAGQQSRIQGYKLGSDFVLLDAYVKLREQTSTSARYIKTSLFEWGGDGFTSNTIDSGTHVQMPSLAVGEITLWDRTTYIDQVQPGFTFFLLLSYSSNAPVSDFWIHGLSLTYGLA